MVSLETIYIQTAKHCHYKEGGRGRGKDTHDDDNINLIAGGDTRGVCGKVARRAGGKKEKE